MFKNITPQDHDYVMRTIGVSTNRRTRRLLASPRFWAKVKRKTLSPLQPKGRAV